MEWTYDASGAKWLKKINNGGVISEKRYLDNLEYSGSNLEAIYFAGGRVVPEGAGYAYQYFIRDHLGNSRVMFKDTVGGPKKSRSERSVDPGPPGSGKIIIIPMA